MSYKSANNKALIKLEIIYIYYIFGKHSYVCTNGMDSNVCYNT